MSFSVTIPQSPRTNIHVATEQAINAAKAGKTLQNSEGSDAAEEAEHLARALGTAFLKLVDEHATDENAEVSGSISGHATPGLKPSPTSAVSFGLYVTLYPPKPVAPTPGS